VIASSNPPVGNGLTDLYAETVGESIPVSATLSHTLLLHNRTGVDVLIGDAVSLGTSPATGLVLADGADFGVHLHSPDRMLARIVDSQNVTGLHVLIVTD